MANVRKDRDWISRVRPGAVLPIIALGVMLIPTLTAGRPGQAPQTGPTFKVLYAFTGGADGCYPLSGVIPDSTGKLLAGTTEECGSYGEGTVFGVSPMTGHEKVLYTFTGSSDGALPEAGLIRDAAGNLYGTAYADGAMGSGTVFEVNPTTGRETVLYSFTGGADGAYPLAGLTHDTSGNLYGTTYNGGNLSGCQYGCGVVFEVSPTGQETVLYSFTGGADGANPYAGVIRDATGNLYGTTAHGGAYGSGTVFELSPTGQETVLHSFTGGADGSVPYAGLIRDPAGNLYGTTIEGGAYRLGVVFELSPTGQETVLCSFPGGADGAAPNASLIRDSAGNIYGTTSWGGINCPGFGCGVVFELSPTGQETVLYRFTGGADGAAPTGSLIRDPAGNLYGTTYGGGNLSACPATGGCGVVFKLRP